jgi:Amt family ammonium transporter
MLVVNSMGLLRVTKEGEGYGLDLHEHGISAYPEYVISALAAPGGMMQELPAAEPRGIAAAKHVPGLAS